MGVTFSNITRYVNSCQIVPIFFSETGNADFRESSFNMTRGGGGEDIEGGLRKFLDTQKGGSEKMEEGSENLYTSKPTGRGGGS